MNKKERWLSSITLLVNVMPISLIAIAQSFVKGPFQVNDPLTGAVQLEFDVWQLNFIGLFCIIPFAIVTVARILRNRGYIARNFMVVLIAALVMNVVYLINMCWLVVSTASKYDVSLVFADFDYISFVCVLVSIAFCMLSNFLPDLPPNPVFGIKNKRTMEYPAGCRSLRSRSVRRGSVADGNFRLLHLGYYLHARRLQPLRRRAPSRNRGNARRRGKQRLILSSE